MAKGIYYGVSNFTPRDLPSGYTQVEYIESSGTQYIDTGVTAKTGVSAEVEFEYTTVTSTNTILGVKTTDVRFYMPHYSSAFYTGYGAAVSINKTATAGVRYDVKTSLLAGSQSMHINGEQVYTGSSIET